MRIFGNIFFLCFILLLITCDSFLELEPKSSFISPFPVKNEDLSVEFGKTLTLKRGNDTLNLFIFSDERTNLIINGKTGDTLFLGSAGKSGDLYYFSQQINDTTYVIFAAKLSNDLMYGLGDGRDQGLLIDDAIENGLYQSIVKSSDSDLNSIRLYPDKTELEKLFTEIIDNSIPDTIIKFEEGFAAILDTVDITAYQDLDFFLRAYPNPVEAFLNVDLKRKSEIFFMFIDVKGESVLEGRLIELQNKIDMTGLPGGTYTFILVDPIALQRKSIRIFKSE